MQKRINKITKFIQYPHNAQENVFNYLIKKGVDSSFGKEHNFNNITNYEDFVNNVPLRTYEEFFPYIKRSRNGEKTFTIPLLFHQFLAYLILIVVSL